MMLEIEKFTKPFEKLSGDLLFSNIKFLEAGIECPFIALNNRTKLFVSALSEKLPWLVKTEESLRSFKEKIGKIEGTRGLFYNVREARNRTPAGHITDIIVVIPDSDRKLELQIYDAFGRLLRTSGLLLFNLHIVKLKGRKPYEIIPKGFR